MTEILYGTDFVYDQVIRRKVFFRVAMDDDRLVLVFDSLSGAFLALYDREMWEQKIRRDGVSVTMETDQVTLQQHIDGVPYVGNLSRQAVATPQHTDAIAESVNSDRTVGKKSTKEDHGDERSS